MSDELSKTVDLIRTASHHPLTKSCLPRVHSPQQPVRLIAAQAYGYMPALGRAALKDVLSVLNDSEPLNRAMTLLALERITGHRLSTSTYEVTAPPSVRAAQIKALQAAVPESRPPLQQEKLK